MKKATRPAGNKSDPPEIQVNLSLSLEEQIAQRAHQLWLHRGRQHGSDLADWFQAEREVKEWHQRRLKVRNSQDSGLTAP